MRKLSELYILLASLERQRYDLDVKITEIKQEIAITLDRHCNDTKGD